MIPTATTQNEEIDLYITTAELYDHVEPYRTRGDVDFYVDMAKEIGGRVLEIGCGTGRVLIPTAQAGINITGLDNSPSMLEICQRKLSQESEQIQKNVWLATGDMRNFDLDEQYDLVTIPFRPFQHMLTVEDQMACLRSVRKHLKPSGTFVFDLFNPSIPGLADESRLDSIHAEPEVVMPDGRKFIRTHKFLSKDYFNQINDLELVHSMVWPDGTTTQSVFAFRMRYLFRFEVEHLLIRSGFSVETIYGGFDKVPYGSRYPGELVIVARRV